MASSPPDHVFIDISVPIEYCCVYFNGNEFAKEVVDTFHEEDISMIVCNGFSPFLNEVLSNRERIWDYLVLEAERHLRQDELTAIDYIDNILEQSSVERNLGIEFNEHYEPDFNEMKTEFKTRGLQEFKNHIDDARLQAKSQRYEFERVSNLDTCSGPCLDA